MGSGVVGFMVTLLGFWSRGSMLIFSAERGGDVELLACTAYQWDVGGRRWVRQWDGT